MGSSQVRACVPRLVAIAAVAFCAWECVGCGVEVGADYPATYADDSPSDAYIATTEPVYYDGHPSYWYGGHWYYRDGAHWRHYDREPPALAQRRARAAPVRRTYARPEPRAEEHGRR